MLVYANWFRIYGKNAESALFRAVGGWIKTKIGQGLRPDTLIDPGIKQYRHRDTNYTLKISTSDSDFPKLYSWVLQHFDDTVRGRQWITEIGLKFLSEEDAVFSCVLKTDEQSALVDQPVIPSRPNIVNFAIQNVSSDEALRFDNNLPGLNVRHVGENLDSYRALYHEISRETRDYPIVLVSPSEDPNSRINPIHLQDELIGLAQVVRVRDDYDRQDMESVLGRRWSAWGGSVNILSVPTNKGRTWGRFFLPDEIQSWGPTQENRVSQLLAWVTNNTNVSRQREHIRPEGVRLLELNRRKQNIRTKANQNDIAELQKDLEEAYEIADSAVNAWEQEKANLETELEITKLDLNEARNEISQKDYEIRNLKDNLQQSGKGHGSDLDVDTLMALSCQDDAPTPIDCLELIESLFGDKCVILDSAKKSARDSSSFEYGTKLLRLLWTLVTSYRDALKNGGDAQARGLLGNHNYAAKESESVMNNKEMRDLRTFTYKGENVEMFRHIKIGMEDNIRKTIRVHFHWDDERELIVIGYCGEHLPVPSHS